jgi:hypothetical protein
MVSNTAWTVRPPAAIGAEMPQFNWAIMGPFILLAGLLFGGTYFLAGHVPHPVPQVAVHGAASAEAASAQGAGIPPGIQIAGRVIGTPHMRSNPSSNSIAIQDMQAGDTVSVSACSAGCAWYLVALPGRPTPGWVSSAFVDIQGDERKLPLAH